VEHRQLGQTGISVSAFGLGCGNSGGIGSAPAFFGQGESCSEAFGLLDRALELGITFLDTADAYGGGRSEEMIGAWLQARGPAVRDRILISSKVGNAVGPDLDRAGLSAAHIARQIDESLGRLGVDHLDMYLAHEVDPSTPLEETVAAFDAAIVSGKVRAVGISNHSALQLAECLEISRANGLHRFEWVQNSFNLIDQVDQAATLDVCRDAGLGFTPFGPLSGGWLTGKYDFAADYPAGSRMSLRPEPYLRYWTREVFDAIDVLATVAGDHGVSPAGMALAWILHHPDLTAGIVGPRRNSHFEPVSEALGLQLNPATVQSLTDTFVEASRP
jgi:aryl-alcohol dehydrogenase-like predicted oxidoreductase